MDKSTNNFNCLIFGNQDENFPNIEPGDVVRLHRMKIDKFRKIHKGKCFSLKDIVVFKDNGNVESNALTYTCTEDDKMMVEEFQNWKKSVNIKYKTFSDITSGEFADILCQIVNVNVVNDDLVILKVWDGSEPQCPLKSYQGVFKETKSYEKLLHLSKYLIDIWIYDCHAKEAAKLEPLQIVEIRNVHMYIPKNSLNSKNQICLHSSTNLKRAISVLTDNNFLVKNFKERLDKLASCSSYEISNDQESEMRTTQKNSGFIFESMDDNIIISDCTDSQLKEINQLEELARINCQTSQSVGNNLKINSNDDVFLNEITDGHLKESEEGISIKIVLNL
ncbi:protection of telomeres protein 1-like [Centruroides vittatus]|uniref:protection of telomeres protein 1-like n=1 Tax=Centruroides vittatus TaxID=120091 RepID=UPI00350FA7E3